MFILLSLALAIANAITPPTYGDPGGPGGKTTTIVAAPMCGDPGGPGGCL